jgi:hypothetical protein
MDRTEIRFVIYHQIGNVEIKETNQSMRTEWEDDQGHVQMKSILQLNLKCLQRW